MRILYIDVDSLRPDHLGCYGYHRDTSPNIDRIAEGGRRFTNFYVTDAPCLPSRTALFSGRYGIHTGVINHGGLYADTRRSGRDRGFKIPPERKSWMAALKEAGLYTASVSPFPSRHDGWQVVRGLREYIDPADSRAPADHHYAFAEEWLENHAAEDDWFFHVNFWDPHTEYNTPEEYGNPFEDEPAPEWPPQETIEEHHASYGPHSAFTPQSASWDWSGTWDCSRMPETISDREEFKQWIDGYDLGIHYMDHHVGKILDLLDRKGVLEETMVVISADHGENHGELNVYGDHHTADDKTSRVPLIVKGPAVEPGVDDDLHYQIDLTATVTELAGGDVRDGWDGESFAASITDGERVGRDHLVLSQGAWACQRSVRWDDWLLMRTYDDGLKPSLDDVMLFDLAEDPHETNDLSEEKPEVVREGLAMLGEWVSDRLLEAARGERGGNPNSPDGVTDPMWEVLREGGPIHSRDRVKPYASYLRSVDREDHAEELEARLD